MNIENTTIDTEYIKTHKELSLPKDIEELEEYLNYWWPHNTQIRAWMLNCYKLGLHHGKEKELQIENDGPWPKRVGPNRYAI